MKALSWSGVVSRGVAITSYRVAMFSGGMVILSRGVAMFGCAVAILSRGVAMFGRGVAILEAENVMTLGVNFTTQISTVVKACI